MVFRDQDAGRRQVPLPTVKSDPCSRSNWMYFVQWTCNCLKTLGGWSATVQRGGKSGPVLHGGGGELPHMGLSPTGCSRKGRKAPRLFCKPRCTAAIKLLNILSFKIVNILHNHINTKRLVSASQALRNELLGPDCLFLQERSLVASRKEKPTGITQTTPFLHTERIQICGIIVPMLPIGVKLDGS